MNFVVTTHLYEWPPSVYLNKTAIDQNDRNYLKNIARADISSMV